MPAFAARALVLGALILVACAHGDGATRRAAAFDSAAYHRAARAAAASLRRNDYAAALPALERALAANPGTDSLLYLAAVSAAQAGDAAAARAWLGRLVEAGSDLVPFAAHLARLGDDAALADATRRLAANAARHDRADVAFRVDEPGLLAEGIAYDPVEPAFYLGSGARRKIIKVVPGHAAVDFVGPRRDVDAIGGLRVDVARRRLWAVTGTDRRMDGYVAGEPERNSLLEIDLKSGAIAGAYPLLAAGEPSLNDVAVDAAGRPFVSDTGEGQIYTLGSDGKTLAPLFAVPPFFAPNGLTFDDRGVVLFVGDATGVHRVDVAARTTTPLGQPAGVSLASFDGLYFVRDARGARLVGVMSGALPGPGRVVAAPLTAALDAVTGFTVLLAHHRDFEGPTTAAIAGGDLYVIANSQLWEPAPPRPTLVLRLPLSR